MSDEDSFQRALKLAEPIVDSIEFHAGPQGGNEESS
jgi:hypothetical protein